MKKILFATMALGMCMTSCMNEEFPNAVQYGYINLNVSNNPVMVTRAGESEPNWQFSATLNGENYNGNISKEETIKVPAGTYIITAKSHTSIDAANVVNIYGERYFEGSSEATTISAGKTQTISISCGQAKNSMLTLVNALNPSVFTEVKLNATSPNRELSLSNEYPSAFYSTNTTINYNISYKYNGSEEETIIKNQGQDYTITIVDAAKDYQIKLSSTDNGNIYVTVTYNNEFGTVESEDFTFDAATGNIASEQ